MMRMSNIGHQRVSKGRGMIFITKITFALSLLVASSQSFAGIDSLVKYASPEGTMSNHNSPAIIKDQSGGYMTGGSILLRGPRPKELSPMHVQTPKLKYDACTGSGDFRFGAFSYISASEFSQFLKNVARASGAYLVKMSIKTACPQCEDIMTYLETVARDINGLTMNQCALAQNLAAGIASKIASSDKQRCMMVSNIYNDDPDLFSSTAKCQDSAGEKNKESEELESLLGDEFNLVWKALSKGAGSDTNFKELMMSVSGTIIGKKEDGKYKFIYKSSLIKDKELLEKFIGTSNGGSKVPLYSCGSDKTKCMEPELKQETLKPEETLYGNISKHFGTLVEKVESDTPKEQLSDEEIALISFSSIPILQLIEMELATKARSEDLIVRVPEFVEVICYDVITNYMQVILDRVVSKVKNLEQAQIDDSIIRNFVNDAETVRNNLKDAKFGAFQKLQIIMQVKERLANQTKEFEFNFSRLMKDIES